MLILGQSCEAVAKLFNIGTTTVKDIMKRKELIKQAIAKDRLFGLNRKVMLLGRKPDVEEQLYAHIVEKTDNGEIVTNKDLLRHASVLTKAMYNEDWSPSAGWLLKFKKRYSINTTRVNDTSQEEEDSLPLYEEEYQIDSEEVHIPEESNSRPNKISSQAVSVLNACDILLDFMSENNFPLKEIITIRIIKDKINEMPEKETSYEVLHEGSSTDSEDDNVKYEFIECEEDVKLGC